MTQSVAGEFDIEADPAESADERDDAPVHPHSLWPGDKGTLVERSRRALLELVRGPYLSCERSPLNWAALRADEAAIRSRLNDLFLELVLDADGEFAFVRAITGDDGNLPRAVRTKSLTFLDTAMLLALRQLLIADEGSARVIIGQDELFEILSVYRTPDRDTYDFTKRLNSSWNNMVNDLRVLHPVGDSGADGPTRAEISPVVRILVDADRARALRASYEAIALDLGPSDPGGTVAKDDADSDDNADDDQGEQ